MLRIALLLFMRLLCIVGATEAKQRMRSIRVLRSLDRACLTGDTAGCTGAEIRVADFKSGARALECE